MDLMPAEHVTYHYPLIFASVATSIVASYAAFCFAERIISSIGARRMWWLTGGSIVLGLGIWSMHYLGMLALHLSIEAFYSLPIVLLSLLLAIGGSAAALHFVSKPHMTPRDLLFGSALLGAGIGAMHYTGMGAMRSCAMQHYSYPMVGASIIVAFVFSWMALSITFRLRNRGTHSEWLRVGGAVLMGLGIAAMHYTAMGAVTFIPGTKSMTRAGMLDIHALSGISVTVTTSVILLGALLTAFLDRITYKNLSEAHSQLKQAHAQLAQAQETLVESELALRIANERLNELSVRDGLTNLYNRRHLDDTLESEWRQASRHASAISLLMIDVDYFKALNDAHGHPAGDKVLQRIAGALQDALEGSGSFVARYGGEEFAVILPCVLPSAAAEAAEKVRQMVCSLAIPHAQGIAEQIVTVSVGICTMVPRGDNRLSSLVQIADQALYKAKSLGRNCVYMGQTEDEDTVSESEFRNTGRRSTDHTTEVLQAQAFTITVDASPIHSRLDEPDIANEKLSIVTPL